MIAGEPRIDRCCRIGGGFRLGPFELIGGTGALADAIRARAARAGFTVSAPQDTTEPWLEVDCSLDGSAPSSSPRVVLCARRGLSSPNLRGAAGFCVLPPADTATLVKLASNQATDRDGMDRSQAFFRGPGYHVEHVGSAPGMVLGRIICQLINEAAFAVGEGVATEQDVDTATTAGLNHPRGRFTWRDSIGADHVHAVLTRLYEERQDDRYRLAPKLLDP